MSTITECVNSESYCATGMESIDNVVSFKNQLNLANLSWEDVVFTHILPYLSWKELFNLRASNWQFKEMVDAYFQQLKCIDLSSVSRLFTSAAFKVVSSNCENLRKLVLNNAHSLVDKDLLPMFKSNLLLSHANLSGCTGLNGTCLLALAVNCKQVKTLLLRDCNWLTAGAIESLITHLESLEVVDISSCSAISNQQLLPFLQKFYKLKQLHLSNLQAVNDTTVLVIARNCGESLEVLDIRGCGNVTDRGVRMIAEYCTKLTTMYVASCTLVTEYSLRLLRSRDIILDRERAGELVPYIPLPVQV